MAQRKKPTEWHYSSELPRLTERGDFEAWVAVTDLPRIPGERGISAFAWQLAPRGSTRIITSDARPSDDDKSDEARAYIAACYRVVEALPTNSSVTINCRSEYIVRAINEWLDRWRCNGWRRSDGKRVAHREIWERLLKARDGGKGEPRNIIVIATHCPTNGSAYREIFEALAEKAREVGFKRRDEVTPLPPVGDY